MTIKMILAVMATVKMGCWMELHPCRHKLGVKIIVIIKQREVTVLIIVYFVSVMNKCLFYIFLCSVTESVCIDCALYYINVPLLNCCFVVEGQEQIVICTFIA